MTVNKKVVVFDKDYIQALEGKVAEDVDDKNFRWLEDGEIKAIVDATSALPTPESKKYFMRNMIGELRDRKVADDELNKLIATEMGIAKSAQERYGNLNTGESKS